ncbi:MAG: NAD-dependent malic enzyme, partial [Nitrosomonas sp.]|nr:NAD-dependent malic enzyme [Nitrosomonas sp.]
GTAELMVMAYRDAGLSALQARERIWFVDRKGLVVSTNEVIKSRVQPFAHVHPPCGFVDAIEAVKPDVLIGATGVANTFTEAVIRKMAEVNERPVIIALSNPTSHTECTAEEAYAWSDGRAIYASGSPFDPVRYKTQNFQPAQGNNAYIFPGIGLGVYASSARLITQSMFLSAARVLSDLVTDTEISKGSVYPSLRRVRTVSKVIAVSVCEVAVREGLIEEKLPEQLEDYIESLMYNPIY